MKHTDQLKNFPLFSELSDEEIRMAMKFIPVREVLYSPKAEIMRFGQNSPYVGFIILIISDLAALVRCFYNVS